jgi:integrase
LARTFFHNSGKKAQTPVNYVSVSEYLALENSTQRLWWKALISVAYGSGLRHNEILNMTWADIDFENQQIHVRAKKETARTIEWEPKDHESRVVPMSDGTVQLLADLQAQAPEGHPYVFVAPERINSMKQREKTGDWTPRSEIVNNVVRDFNVTRRRAGTERCTLHDLRRSAITNWAQRLPIQAVQQLAGRADIATTRKYYLSVRPEDLASANRILSSILAGKHDD